MALIAPMSIVGYLQKHDIHRAPWIGGSTSKRLDGSSKFSLAVRATTLIMVSPLAPEMHRESFASGRFAKLPNQEERARIGGLSAKSGPSRASAEGASLPLREGDSELCQTVFRRGWRQESMKGVCECRTIGNSPGTVGASAGKSASGSAPRLS